MSTYTLTVSRRNGDRYTLTVVAATGVAASQLALDADPQAAHIMGSVA
jgi:hypothetical protein